MLIAVLIVVIFTLVASAHLIENRSLPNPRFGWLRSAQVFFVMLVAGVIIIGDQKKLQDAGLMIDAKNKIIGEQRDALVSLETQLEKLVSDPPKKQSAVTPPAKDTVEDIYNPEESDGSKSSRIDELKKRYEELLVTHFILRKCEKVNATDYHIITSALAQDMASVGAPSRLQYDILIAAQGSYKEMYGKTLCSNADINTLLGPYQNYIGSIETQYNVP